MTKKIIAIILCMILVVSLFPIGIISNATGDDFTISIIADKAVYHRGDTITYTVKIKQTGTLASYAFKLDVPNGLTYLDSTPSSSASKELGFNVDVSDYTTIDIIRNATTNEVENYIFSGLGLNAFSGTNEVTLGTIRFTVNKDITYGSYSMKVKAGATAENTDSVAKTIYTNNSNVVIEQVKVPSTSVTITPASLDVVVGKTTQLTAKLSPDDTTDNVTWKSEKESVATVDKNGLVKGISIGTTKIIATTTSGKTAEATINVKCNHSKTTKHEAVASTCKEQGHGEYYTCNICGAIISGSDKKLPLADHNYGEWHEEILPKHENKQSLPGTKGYYQCSVCGKYFDKNHNEIKDLTIPAEEHTAEGNYKFDTEKHWKECACGILMQEETHKPAEAVKENEVAATCTTDGSHDEVVKCSVCGYEISRTKVTDKATGHTKGEMKIENVKVATCTEEGSHDEVYYCTVCGEEISRTNVTDKALGHKPAEIVKENIVPATHSSEGTYDEVVYCSVCNTELSRKKKTTPMVPHSAKDDTWENDENNHWQICGCGVKINTATHTRTDAVKENVKAPTCTEEGSHDEVVYCSVCHRELSRTKVTDKAIGHKEAEAVKENIKEPTCTEDGSHDEVIYCSVCNEELSRIKVTDKALGHTGGTATCSHKAICTRCGKEYGELNSNNHTGNIEIKNAKEPTFVEEGYTGDKYCEDCGKLLEKGTKIDKFTYKMLDGMNGEHKEKTTDSLTFKSNGKLENLVSVFVDETKLTENVDYTTKSGSTIVTLSADYLNKLAVGEHKITMNYNDGGVVSTDFTISEVKNENKNTPEIANEVENTATFEATNETEDIATPQVATETTENKQSITPKTSDESNMNLWITGTILSGICLLGILKWDIAKKNKRVSKHSK